MNDLDRPPPVTFLSYEQAQELMDGALAKIVAGADELPAGLAMLERAKTEEAWKVLHFISWKNCLVAFVQPVRGQLRRQSRHQIALRLRECNIRYRDIATILGSAQSTITRDFQLDTAGVEILDVPAKRPVDNTKTANGQTLRKNKFGGPPRRDLLKSWREAVDQMGRRVASLDDMTKDNRYRARRQDMIIATHGDLLRAHEFLTKIIADFEAHKTEEYPES